VAFLRIAGLVLFISIPALGYIELVSGPVDDPDDHQIQKYAAFVASNHAVLGRCDTLEPVCAPSSKSFIAIRTIPFEKYQGHLAGVFNIETKYLISDVVGETVYKNTQSLLKPIAEGLTSTDAERTDAEQRLKVLGAIMTRFNEAVRLKRHLSWNENVPDDQKLQIEKLQRQFREVMTPFNFAEEVNVKAPLVAFEPSTEKSWLLVNQSLDSAGAEAACTSAGNGYRLPKAEEWSLAKRWIMTSKLQKAAKTNNAAFPIHLKDVSQGANDITLCVTELPVEGLER
jgi:hypothetical protein